jgi:hypothetical protein
MSLKLNSESKGFCLGAEAGGTGIHHRRPTRAPESPHVAPEKIFEAAAHCFGDVAVGSEYPL